MLYFSCVFFLKVLPKKTYYIKCVKYQYMGFTWKYVCGAL